MRALLLMTGILISLFTLETTLRIVPYEGAYERSKLSSRFHPYYESPAPALSALPSGSDHITPNTSIFIHGREVSLQKQAGTQRVVFMGDSGTFGSGVPFEKSFPFVFQEALGRLAPLERIEVINAGRRGLSTVGEIHLLKDDLLRLQPDVVVLGVFMANDINFNLAHAGVEELSVINTAILKTFDSLRRHSALCHFLYLRFLVLNTRYKIVERAGPREAQWIPVEYRLIDPHGLSLVNYLHGEIASYWVPFSPLIRQAFSVLESALKEFVDLSKQHHFTPIAVIIPTSSSLAGRLSMQTFPDALADLRRDGFDIKESDLDVAAPTREVLALCQKLLLSCIDPTNKLANTLGQESFLLHDDHLSISGHKLVGELVAEKFQRMGLPNP